MNKGKYMLRVYNKIGNIRNDVYFHNLYELLQQYIKNRISLIDSKNPTIWIHDGKNYVRVHSFQFKELNPDNYRRYLKERVIDTDYLLEEEMKQNRFMTILDLFTKRTGIINDYTTVIIRDDDFHMIASGKWFESSILDYMNKEIEGFTWEKGNTVYIDIVK